MRIEPKSAAAMADALDQILDISSLSTFLSLLFQITLEKSVNWLVGDYIVIASTGHRHSQIENEKRQITAISEGIL